MYAHHELKQFANIAVDKLYGDLKSGKIDALGINEIRVELANLMKKMTGQERNTLEELACRAVVMKTLK